MGKILEIAHVAHFSFELGELVEIWPHIALGGTVSIAIGGSIITLLAGLFSIGHAQETGRTLAQQRAWKLGFAATIAALARGEDWTPTLPSNVVEGYQQSRGKNAAIRMLKEMGRETGLAFLKPFERVGRTRVLQLVGYE